MVMDITEIEMEMEMVMDITEMEMEVLRMDI